jgi:hypothetical protein
MDTLFATAAALGLALSSASAANAAPDPGKDSEVAELRRQIAEMQKRLDRVEDDAVTEAAQAKAKLSPSTSGGAKPSAPPPPENTVSAPLDVSLQDPRVRAAFQLSGGPTMPGPNCCCRA